MLQDVIGLCITIIVIVIITKGGYYHRPVMHCGQNGRPSVAHFIFESVTAEVTETQNNFLEIQHTPRKLLIVQ